MYTKDTLKVTTERETDDAFGIRKCKGKPTFTIRSSEVHPKKTQRSVAMRWF